MSRKLRIIALTFLLGIASLVLVCITISPLEIRRLSLDKNRDVLFQSSVEDPVLFDIRILESYTNVWIRNEKILYKRAVVFRSSIAATGLFSLLASIVMFII